MSKGKIEVVQKLEFDVVHRVMGHEGKCKFLLWPVLLSDIGAIEVNKVIVEETPNCKVMVEGECK